MNRPPAPASKLRQTLCASTLALNHTLLQSAVKAALVWYSPQRLQPGQWHHHSPDGFCQPQIFLKQEACPGHLISCDTLSERLPVSKDKTSRLYSPSISFYRNPTVFCRATSQEILWASLKRTCFYNRVYNKTVSSCNTCTLWSQARIDSFATLKGTEPSRTFCF